LSKKIELRSLDVNFAFDDFDDDVLRVEGIILTGFKSHVLGTPDKKQWQEIIEPGVFGEALERAFDSGRNIEFLENHDPLKILSSTKNGSLTLEENKDGLYFEARIVKTTWGKDLYLLVKEGIIEGLSFGMTVREEEWFQDENGMAIRLIKKIDLYEVSALKTPAYPMTFLESRGLELAEVNVPNNLEKRNLGGQFMNGEEITPQKFYEGLTLIAEKMDAILNQLKANEEAKTIEGLQEAKEVLAKVETLVDKIAPDEAKEDVAEEEKVAEPEVANEEKPANEDSDNTDGNNDSNNEDQAEKNDAPQDGDVEPKEVQSEDEKPSDDEDKKNKAELRAWLENNKMEVPE
jgi:HK97 family phage prohead protease